MTSRQVWLDLYPDQIEQIEAIPICPICGERCDTYFVLTDETLGIDEMIVGCESCYDQVFPLEMDAITWDKEHGRD
jgi:hypothetical protein